MMLNPLNAEIHEKLPLKWIKRRKKLLPYTESSFSDTHVRHFFFFLEI